MLTTIEGYQEIIRQQRQVCVRGGGSKTALTCTEDGVTLVSTAGLSGVLEYQPDEFTFSALAGTPVAELERILAEYDQYLPFDPLLAEAGATLGGCVASGLSGPGRYRYGGVRDFILGVQFIDGQGGLVRAGGKVVKNAAGFDLPKFMVGSLGCYGMLVELSFKVLPRPTATATLRARYESLVNGLAALVRLTRQPLEIFALELEQDASLLVQVGGAPETLNARLERLRLLLGGVEVETLTEEAERELWQMRREFAWLPQGWSLVKIPLTPRRAPALEAELESAGAMRIYSAGANLAWVGWPGETGVLDALLTRLDLSGLKVLGKPGEARLGMQTGASFERRMKQALDPLGRFVCAR